jgi:hypothetical protein
VTFTTFSESSDTWIENKRQLLDDDELPPPPYTEILETLRSAESWIPIPLELTHNRYIISSNLHKQLQEEFDVEFPWHSSKMIA